MDKRDTQSRQYMSKKDMEELERFKATCDRMLKKHTKSKETARAYLLKQGYIDEHGNLTKEYQS